MDGVGLNVAQVKATHRWLVSGTPFSRGIDKLHRQLQLLQVPTYVWFVFGLVCTVPVPGNDVTLSTAGNVIEARMSNQPALLQTLARLRST